MMLHKILALAVVAGMAVSAVMLPMSVSAQSALALQVCESVTYSGAAQIYTISGCGDSFPVGTKQLAVVLTGLPLNSKWAAVVTDANGKTLTPDHVAIVRHDPSIGAWVHTGQLPAGSYMVAARTPEGALLTQTSFTLTPP